MVEFEWVTALAKCSISEVFEQLKLQVKDDVGIRNSLYTDGTSYGFKLVSNERDFSVMLDNHPTIHRSVCQVYSCPY